MRPATTLDSGRTSNVTEPPPAETKSSEGPEDLAPDPCPDPWSRLSLLWLAALFLFIAFIQAPGKIEADTKLTVVTSPIAWIHGALHLWTPNLYSGATQSLNFGYLFPMAPFFALMHLLHVPVWCSERIWLALLFTASCWGVVRLAEALGIGSRWVRVLGGVAYVIAPISVTWTSRTGTLIAVLLLPWLIQPLVVGARTGSPRKAAAR
jgi:arabinofuranan 3-O-arabinosyltransferase